MKNPNPLMLLRIAQGDAYCMATEYIKLPRDQAVYDAAKKFERYVRHPVHMLDAGMYTDDTQMSIAVVEQLSSDELPTKLCFANHFVESFLRDRRDGYSRGFQAILEKSRSGQELLDKLIPDSTKNGAAMRSVPLGVIQNVKEMLEIATTQAKVTHDSEQGIVSSCAIAYLSHQALYTNDSYSEICKQLAAFWPKYEVAFTEPWDGPVVDKSANGMFDVGINTVWAVCTLLKENEILMGILDQVIEWGGDTDSVAAIAWGIGSARMREDIPEFLEYQLEPNGLYGAKFLRDLGSRLMEKYGKSEAKEA